MMTSNWFCMPAEKLRSFLSMGREKKSIRL